MMNFNRKLRLTIAPFLLAAVVTVTCPSFVQGSATSLPSGNWTFRVSPYVGGNNGQVPVVTTAVFVDIQKAAGITKVNLVNLSSKPVTSVQLSLVLSREGYPELPLRQWTSSSLPCPSGFDQGVRLSLLFPATPLMSFENVGDSVAKNGAISGDFVLTVAVYGIQFADGSTWSIDDPSTDGLFIAERAGNCETTGCRVASPGVRDCSQSSTNGSNSTPENIVVSKAGDCDSSGGQEVSAEIMAFYLQRS